MPNFKIPKFRAPIIAYSEIIPPTLWQRLSRQEPRYRVRIKRSAPDQINCRCSIKAIM